MDKDVGAEEGEQRAEQREMIRIKYLPPLGLTQSDQAATTCTGQDKNRRIIGNRRQFSQRAITF